MVYGLLGGGRGGRRRGLGWGEDTDNPSQHSVMRALMREAEEALNTLAEALYPDYQEGFLSIIMSQLIWPRI